MSVKGSADIVFCIDVSSSMRPCLDGVRRNILDFVKSLESGQQRIDWRIDLLAHCCDERGGAFAAANLRTQGLDLVRALYQVREQSSFFTTDLDVFQKRMEELEVVGDEATLVALDFALDFPWRPRSQSRRVVVCLTDEPLETGAIVDQQLAQLPKLIDKIQNLGVMLFLVAPDSEAYSRLAEVDKSEYQVVHTANDGLRSVDFSKVLTHIGKTISYSNAQSGDEPTRPPPLFNQDQWTRSNAKLRGK